MWPRRRVAAVSSAPLMLRSRGIAIRATIAMMKITIDSSISVKPRSPVRRGLTTSSEIPAVDVAVFVAAALLTVGAEALEDELLPVAEVDVMVPPRILGNLLHVTLGVVLPRLGSARGLLHQGGQALVGRRITPVVELVQVETLLELFEVGLGFGDASGIGLADDVHRHDGGKQSDDEHHDQDLDQRESGGSSEDGCVSAHIRSLRGLTPRAAGKFALRRVRYQRHRGRANHPPAQRIS